MMHTEITNGSATVITVKPIYQTAYRPAVRRSMMAIQEILRGQELLAIPSEVAHNLLSP